MATRMLAVASGATDGHRVMVCRSCGLARGEAEASLRDSPSGGEDYTQAAHCLSWCDRVCGLRVD